MKIIIIPVVPARGGAEVALRIYYKTFHIYRTFRRRAPARPVRGRCVRVCCTIAVQEHDLRATTLHCKARRRLSSHFTVTSSHPALQKPHFISSQAAIYQLFSHSKLSYREAFTQRSQKLLHTDAFTQRNFYTKRLLHSKL